MLYSSKFSKGKCNWQFFMVKVCNNYVSGNCPASSSVGYNILI